MASLNGVSSSAGRPRASSGDSVFSWMPFVRGAARVMPTSCSRYEAAESTVTTRLALEAALVRLRAVDLPAKDRLATAVDVEATDLLRRPKTEA